MITSSVIVGLGRMFDQIPKETRFGDGMAERRNRSMSNYRIRESRNSGKEENIFERTGAKKIVIQIE
jgi:hypothetical protein